ncbi:putative ribosomal RNA large subunit methyltransferase J [Ancylostoma ceylanicum]|uniref:Putative ribosomal RNA large subunit methyltransferase J n=1 Tax=Ancylostoma ceylanicum TaxID=53326 RepID=A0A0D6M0M6_9BILA|nr:putative ribosomal RNA large subunit methyltransferase J [Ancylostoma ceylanicum]
MLLDDDLILRHPEQWYFGDDDSGDICKDAPEEQESAILPLLEAEIEAAKKLLTFFGSLVIKIYTMFLPETRSLIQNIASYFDDVYVFKPMSSKGGNNERYLICLRFRGDRAKVTEQTKAEAEELGVYRDRIFSEFHKRALTKFISTPTRESHLNQQALERPWIDMFGKNYVERLRCINDEHSALEHLRIFLREDLMGELEEGENEVEVEFAEDELEFFGWEGYKLVHERTIIDLCTSTSSHEPSHYAKSLEMLGNVVVDASKLTSSKDWLFILQGFLSGVRDERIEQLELVWSEPSIPFIFSRFSASVIALLSVMFFQFKIGSGHQVAVFTKPNYSEDIPGSFESYLTMLDELLPKKGSMRCCVPPSMLAMFHPYILDLNRHQWRQLLDGEELGVN